MSNKKLNKKPKAKTPPLKMQDLMGLHQNILILDQNIKQNINTIFQNSKEIHDFKQFCFKNDIACEEAYKEFQEEQEKKRERAREIRNDEDLSREDKIGKAEEEEIPESWVVDPLPKKKDKEKSGPKKTS